MKQTRLESLLEVVVGTAAGFLVSMVTWQLIAWPLFGYRVTLWDNLLISAIFTVVSIARQYVFRRFFNAGIHKAIHRFVRSLYRRKTCI